MTFHMSSLVLIRKSFLINPSLFSILFNNFLLCLYILRNLVVFDFITCVSFCTEIIIIERKRAEPLAAIAYFPLQNVKKYGFF